MRLFSTTFLTATLVSRVKTSSERARTLVDPHPDHRSVFVVDNILSEDACKQLIASSSPETPSGPATSLTRTRGLSATRTRVRFRVRSWRGASIDVLRLSIRDTDRHSLPRNIWRLEESGVPACLNEDFLFGNYPAKGGFAPHSDGATAKGLNSEVLLLRYHLPEHACLKAAARGSISVRKPRMWSLMKEGGRAAERLVLRGPTPYRKKLWHFDQRLVHEGIPPMVIGSISSARTSCSRGLSRCLWKTQTRSRTERAVDLRSAAAADAPQTIPR